MSSDYAVLDAKILAAYLHKQHYIGLIPLVEENSRQLQRISDEETRANSEGSFAAENEYRKSRVAIRSAYLERDNAAAEEASLESIKAAMVAANSADTFSWIEKDYADWLEERDVAYQKYREENPPKETEEEREEEENLWRRKVAAGKILEGIEGVDHSSCIPNGGFEKLVGPKRWAAFIASVSAIAENGGPEIPEK